MSTLKLRSLTLLFALTITAAPLFAGPTDPVPTGGSTPTVDIGPTDPVPVGGIIEDILSGFPIT
jgi:hypothetical protein